MRRNRPYPKKMDPEPVGSSEPTCTLAGGDAYGIKFEDTPASELQGTPTTTPFDRWGSGAFAIERNMRNGIRRQKRIGLW